MLQYLQQAHVGLDEAAHGPAEADILADAAAGHRAKPDVFHRSNRSASFLEN